VRTDPWPEWFDWFTTTPEATQRVHGEFFVCAVPLVHWLKRQDPAAIPGTLRHMVKKAVAKTNGSFDPTLVFTLDASSGRTTNQATVHVSLMDTSSGVAGPVVETRFIQMGHPESYIQMIQHVDLVARMVGCYPPFREVFE